MMRALQLGVFIGAALASVAWAAPGTPTFDDSEVIFSVCVGVLTYRALKRRGEIVRWSAAVLVIAATWSAVSSAPALVDRYLVYRDPAKGRAQIEQVALEAFPLVMTVAEKEPALWQRAESQALASWQANHGRLTRELIFQIIQVFYPVNARLYEVAAGAGDNTVLKWALSRHQVDLMLAEISLKECGEHLQGAKILAPLTDDGKAMVQREQDYLRAAYREGFELQRSAPNRQIGRALLQRALGTTKLPEDIVFNRNNLTADRLCSLWLDVSKGLFTLPPTDAAALTRFLFQSQPASI